MILMIDNFCSFTYNIVQYLRELGQPVAVFKNNDLSMQDIHALQPKAIVLGPGPCTPNEAGICLPILTSLSLPILGVCLGHQAIAQAFGGKVVNASEVMHGRVCAIDHDGTGVFAGLPPAFLATRYHSLVIDKSCVPECLHINAWASSRQGESEIMGVCHKSLPIHGVQFHPESILSEHGHRLFYNFLQTYALV